MILFANCESKQKRKIKMRFSVDYTCIRDRRHSVEPTYIHIRQRTWWYNEKKNVKVKHIKVPHMSQGTHSIYWQCLSLFAFNLFLCRTLETPAANLFLFPFHLCVCLRQCSMLYLVWNAFAVRMLLVSQCRNTTSHFQFSQHATAKRCNAHGDNIEPNSTEPKHGKR